MLYLYLEFEMSLAGLAALSMGRIALATPEEAGRKVIRTLRRGSLLSIPASKIY